MEITVNGCKVEMTGLNDIISYKKRLYQDIVNLKEELKEKEEELKRFETYLQYNCNHNWITDSVDQMNGYRQGILIKYCEKCELTIT
tara:strand:+ start:191 stop:451 length:261 start_codon:yes stop_codon:yes gene_type:complete